MEDVAQAVAPQQQEEEEPYIAHKLSDHTPRTRGEERTIGRTCGRAPRLTRFLFVSDVVRCVRLTSSVAVFPPLPLSSNSAAVVAAEDVHVAHVLLLKGKWSDHMGHRREGGGGRMYLFVEEMMFLIEQGAIEVVTQDMPLSIQEAYTILHETGGQGKSSSATRTQSKQMNTQKTTLISSVFV